MDIATTIRVRGLPWQSTPQDIIEFFEGCQIKDGEDGICMLLTEEGRPSGEALIEMETIKDYDKGLEYDKKHMGSRYIEVFAAQPQDLVRAIHRSSFSGNDTNRNGSGAGDEEGYVRLRGLPYGSRRQQIEEFFEGLKIPQDGIVLPTDHLGRSSGEAYVKFVSRDQAEKALGKHKEKIGHRYIEIFKSSSQEFRSVRFDAGRMFQKPQGPPEQWFPPYRPVDGPRMRYNPRVAPYDRFLDGPRGPYAMPRNAPPFRRPPEWEDYYLRDRPVMRYPDAPGPLYSRRRHVVRMRGLPFKASQGDVHEFFRPLLPINVRILMDDTGRVSGEAEVEFGTHEEAVRAMNKDKANMQHRYIELFLESEPFPTEPPHSGPVHPVHPHQPSHPGHPTHAAHPGHPTHVPHPAHAPMMPPPLYGGMRSYHSHAGNAANELSSLYGGPGMPRPAVDYRHRM